MGFGKLTVETICKADIFMKPGRVVGYKMCNMWCSLHRVDNYIKYDILKAFGGYPA